MSCGDKTPQKLIWLWVVMNMTIKNINPQLFNLEDVQDWKKNFYEEGYVVIKDIISSNENKEATSLFKKEWKIVSPNFDWEDKHTWTTKNIPMVYGKGMAMFNGFGQSQFMWYLRTKKNVKEAFVCLFEDEDLVVSFDGFSVFLSKKQKSPIWLHQDQRSQDNTISVQGMVNLCPVSSKDAGFICVPKSHLTLVPPPSNSDFIVLSKEDEHYTKAVKLCIPENCLILWNSKTIHANTGMGSKEDELNRLTAYIAFCPRSRQSKEVHKQRLEGYSKGHTSNHWANKHEVKTVPFHIRKSYKEKGFKDLKSPTICEKILELI